MRHFRRGLCRVGQCHMRYAKARPHRLRRFIKCVAVTAMIFVMTSAVAAQATSPAPAEGTLPDLQKYPGLLPEFGQLYEKLERDVQVPPARSQSRLLPLLPESTVFYAAFPNYGEASHQALTIFHQELQQSSALRDWWTHGEMAANGPKIEDALEKFYRLSQYLGDEIVVSGTTERGKDPSVLIVAEVRKPGLKTFLQQMTRELAGNAEIPMRLFDVKELAAATDTPPAKQLTLLIRPDLVVAGLDVATLRSFNARLDKSSQEFASTPFGQRVAHAYEGGSTVVAAVDLQKIIRQLPAGTEQNQKLLQRTGFADAKYLVWEHKNIAGQAASQAELSFTFPRHGVASWLAAPGRLGSLDFVSPKAMLAGAVLLKNPAEIFEDVREIATASNPDALAALPQMEQGLKVSFKDDLLSRLGGEIGYEVGSLKQPTPAWKAILKVNDPEHLQATLETLLASIRLVVQQSEDGGVTYHTLRIPSAPTTGITYAFVDGYLVIASSRETVTEAIRLHRDGGSLAKSEKFLAALPPGHTGEASALFYEVPSAMTALSMSRLLPQMAESLSQSAADAGPVVMCAYGGETALREASRNGSVDTGAFLIGAAIAIPNLLRARIAANESSAVSNIRTANTAMITYQSTFQIVGYASTIAALGPSASTGCTTPASGNACLVDWLVAQASAAGSAKSGYYFLDAAGTTVSGILLGYTLDGLPASVNQTGVRGFCSNEDAVIRYTAVGSAASGSNTKCAAYTGLR